MRMRGRGKGRRGTDLTEFKDAPSPRSVVKRNVGRSRFYAINPATDRPRIFAWYTPWYRFVLTFDVSTLRALIARTLNKYNDRATSVTLNVKSLFFSS